MQIIARCKQETGDIWHAHYGVAAIAGYFFIKENNLPVRTNEVIRAQATEMITKHQLGVSSQPTEVIASKNAEKAILAALNESIDKLHWVGHNVIYAALSLAALRELGEGDSSREMQGIEALIRSFVKTIPGRFWIGYSTSEVKKLLITDEDNMPRIENLHQLSRFILDELASFKQIYRAEAHHDLIGHMLTFSHALNIMFNLGHREFFIRGMPSIMQLVKVLRKSRDINPSDLTRLVSPVDHLPLVRGLRSEWLPSEAEFWSRDLLSHDWDYGHLFKFSFSFYNHKNLLMNVPAQAIENFRYLIHID